MYFLYQISVWSLEGLFPLSTHFYKHLLYLMSKLSSVWNIILHASVYDNAVTIELARPSLIQLLFLRKNNTGKNVSNTGKTQGKQGISSWLECGHPDFLTEIWKLELQIWIRWIVNLPPSLPPQRWKLAMENFDFRFKLNSIPPSKKENS